MDLLLALSGVAELVAFILLTLAVEWVRVLRLPAGERGYALYHAVSATLVLVGFVLLSVVAGLPTPFVLFQYARDLPLIFQLVGAALVVVQGVRLGLELRRLAAVREAQRARARAKRNPTWPFGSDRLDPS